ncbi:DUF6115 domain-containing protein [Schnuerera sp.]|uniref:DUF6115 domain-containing protein n=1 Tax=Schnuerera sp. TaxID=2794844 RepID=UPI002BED0DDA|nr:hypothetical protein [Schnuerera sp.]HSH36709.1 hypothetical protein [Schnuerera sp.]
MLSIVLNVIGLLCILISLILITKINKKEKDIYNEILVIHEDIKYYSHVIEDTLNNFDDLIETSLHKFTVLQKDRQKNVNKEELMKKTHENKNNLLDKSTNENIHNEELNRKIFQLKNLGLSNEEIAKKLNKGIREVDIIIKMWPNIYKENVYTHIKKY